MKILLCSMLSFATFTANAGLDCDIKIGAGEKAIESKAVFKIREESKESTTYEAVKDGYTFRADIHKKGSLLPHRVNIIEQDSDNRSVAFSGDMKPNNPDAVFGTALVNEKSNPPKFAKLICRLKQ